MAAIVETDAGNAIAHVERARRVATAARTQELASQASSMIESLDPEEAHDDAC